MVANPDYWGGAPAIQTLVWEYIQDGQTRLNAFLAGQAQAIDRVPPEQLPVLEATDGVELISVTGFENVNLWMRQDAAAPWDRANLKLREAVAWAIDRQALVDSLVEGASEVAADAHPQRRGLRGAAGAGLWPRSRQGEGGAGRSRVRRGEGPTLPLWGVTGFLPRGPEVARRSPTRSGRPGSRSSCRSPTSPR